MGLAVLTDWKNKSYNSILVIIDYLMKIVYYKLIKVTIDALSLAKVIIDIVMHHKGISKSIITN